MSNAKITLAFGSAGSPWLIHTYSKIGESYDVKFLTSQEGVAHEWASHVKTTGSTLKKASPQLSPIIVNILGRTFPDWDRLSKVNCHLRDSDIVHTTELVSGPSIQVAKQKKKYRFKHVVTVWENIANRLNWLPRVKRIKRDVIKSADWFIAVSERAKTALILDGVKPERITVIPPASIQSNTKSLPEIDRQCFNLLFVGKKQRSKGMAELLKSLWLVQQDSRMIGKNIRLICLGVEPSKGPYRHILKKYNLDSMIQEIPFVPHEDVMGYYMQADALVVPSRITGVWQEQWGMVFMEAMTNGLPIITTLSGSIPEVTSGAAVYAAPNDHHTLRDQIIELATNPELCSKLSHAGKTRAKTFTPESVGNQIRLVYENLLS